MEQIELEKEREVEKLKLELSNQCDQSNEHVKAKGKSLSLLVIERVFLVDTLIIMIGLNNSRFCVLDEKIIELVALNNRLDQSEKEKEAIIDDIKCQLGNALDENKKLIIDIGTNRDLEDALCKEQKKRKEVASKLEELTELILTRDETISQLKIEAEKSLEDLKHLEDNSITEANSRNSEINKLKQEVSNKVRNNIFLNQNIK